MSPMKPDFPEVTCVSFSAHVAAAPWDYEEAMVSEITGVIHGMVSETEEADFGTITLLKLSVSEAINRRLSLESICDAHSDYLLSVFNAICDEDEEAKEELEIEPGWSDLLVLAGFDVKPEYRKSAIVVKAFETAIAFFGSGGVIVAAMEGKHFVGLDLMIDEWRALGFKRIAGSQFVFRDNACLNPYRAELENDDDE